MVWNVGLMQDGIHGVLPFFTSRNRKMLVLVVLHSQIHEGSNTKKNIVKGMKMKKTKYLYIQLGVIIIRAQYDPP